LERGLHVYAAFFMTSNICLRDYQEVAVGEIRSEFRVGNTPVLFVLPTGGGKTYTFSYIAASASDKGRSVCIIVHRKELLLQASASLTALGIAHGLISPDFTPTRNAMVQVASVDTLLQRLKKQTYKFGLVIFDEAHHVVAGNKWGRVYEQLGSPHMLGVTATPVRTDGKGLGEHAGGVFKSMVLGPSVVELIARGMLINPCVYASPIVPEIDDLKTNRDGDYNLQELAARVDKPRITGSAVAHYSKICPGARAIVFCSSIEHAKHVAAEFNLAGYRFELLVGAPHMSDTERTAVNRRLRRGEIHGACTVDLVSEGYDLPDLEACIMLRPTASEALFIQQVGRVMRPAPGKTTCYLLDHVANVGTLVDGEFKRKHGLPNELREWTLDGRKKKKKGPKEPEEAKIDIKQCPECFTAHEAAPVCPSCGFEYPAKSRSLEQVEGELQEITAEMQERMKLQQRSAQASAKSVEDMMAQLGYSRGRAEAIVRAREEKAAIRTALNIDLQDWQKKTGQSPNQTFGVYLSDLKMMKPKALKELRERFDAHCLAHLGARPGDNPGFADYLQQTLLPNNSQPRGESAF
jgi:superfamily II DNA or RNA helicase